MCLEALARPPLWSRFSKKLSFRIVKPNNSGFFSEKQAEAREMRLAVGSEGNLDEGNVVKFFFLVDPSDGMIVDVKFQVFGQAVLIGAADVACDLLVGKDYEQARHVSAELIDKELQDKGEESAFPEESLGHLNLILDAIENGLDQLTDIALPKRYQTPIPQGGAKEAHGGYPGWLQLSKENKIAVIEEVFKSDVRPYIELDDGGIEILDLINDRELIIAYQGACTSCFSSIGTTLASIQEIVQDKVHPDIIVVPNLDDLKF